jgi:UDP-N-acetylglucosamine--N-acetylmuramyl-(pentapeptide) pyrophosphoryl-undecaprenol N-acetylglucosamine transferase
VEPNIVPSRTARWLSRSVSEICTAFPETATLLPTNASIHVTGFPVPAGVAALAAAPPAALRINENHPRRLVILGGSSGAVSLNHAAPAALGRLRRCLEGWDVVHQTGPGQLQAVEERYAQSGANALAVSLIDDLAHVLAETDLVVCRAGGGTLAELAVAGVPAILLPHPDAPDDHQRANAEVYARAGACRVIDEEACEGRLDEALGREIELLLSDSSARAGMATGMRSFSRPGAAQEIAALCASLLSASGEITAAAA